MTRIIVVEDEELISTMLKINLEREGYKVSCCKDAESLLKNDVNADVILLDIMLPGMNGDQALSVLRSRGINIPILMLTAKHDIQTKVTALDLGADDYLAKPFNMSELLARIRALIRRSQGERTVPSNKIIRIRQFEINLETHESSSNLGTVILTDKETCLLNYFVQNPSVILSRMDILEEVWGLNVDPTPRTIDNFILRFRKLYEVNPEKPCHFITVRSSGYRFEPSGETKGEPV